jgi:hypothetical protein
MTANNSYSTCPVCFESTEMKLENEKSPEIKHLFSSDSAFIGPGKERSVTDTYAFSGEGYPNFWVHIFPICPKCCGTGLVVDSEDFTKLQSEVKMATENMQNIIKAFSKEPSVLKEHAERLTYVLTPLIIRRALRLVETPARHSYARYLANLFNLVI